MTIDSIQNTRVGGDNIFVIIVAAGSGTRFGASIPKQFLPLNGKPVLAHTVEAIHSALPQARIILVLSDEGRSLWDKVSQDYNPPVVSIVKGGASRSESVCNALSIIDRDDEDAVVLIHDGARPLVNADMVQALVRRIMKKDIQAVVPALPLTEAIAEIHGDCLLSANREKFRTVQTPQAFKAAVLIDAYKKADGTIMADDAAIAATFGGVDIHFVNGHPQNIKITHPGDLAVAESILANPKPYQY